MYEHVGLVHLLYVQIVVFILYAIRLCFVKFTYIYFSIHRVILIQAVVDDLLWLFCVFWVENSKYKDFITLTDIKKNDHVNKKMHQWFSSMNFKL